MILKVEHDIWLMKASVSNIFLIKCPINGFGNFHYAIILLMNNKTSKHNFKALFMPRKIFS